MAVTKGTTPLNTRWLSDNSSVLALSNLDTPLDWPFLTLKANVLAEGRIYVFYVAKFSPRDKQVRLSSYYSGIYAMRLKARLSGSSGGGPGEQGPKAWHFLGVSPKGRSARDPVPAVRRRVD
jgi:hypothetical protein